MTLMPQRVRHGGRGRSAALPPSRTLTYKRLAMPNASPKAGGTSLSVVFLWSTGPGAKPDAAATFIESLEKTAPKAKLFCTLSANTVSLELQVDLPGKTELPLKLMEAQAPKAGARFMDMLRVPEEKREVFRSRFLRPPSGRPVAGKSFKEIAVAVRDHLASLGARPSDPRPIPAAPSPGAGRPENRQTPRHDVLLSVQFKTRGDFVDEYATNISMGGLFIRTPARPALDTQVPIAVELPTGEKLEGKARVVRVVEDPENGGIGVTFLEDAAFREALKKYLDGLPRA